MATHFISLLKCKLLNIRISLLVLLAPTLSGCPTQQEYATSLAGNWRGTLQNSSWCLTLRGHGSSEKGEGAVTYRSTYEEGGEISGLYAEGIWFVGIGGRLQMNLNTLPLNNSFEPLPTEKLKTSSFRYLIISLDQDELVYREHNANDSFGEKYTSMRVESCNTFFND